MKGIVFVLLLMLCYSSVSFAKPKPNPNWFCFKGEDKSGQVVEACERELTTCNKDVDVLPNFESPPICYSRDKAFVFSFTHKSTGVIEKWAFPDLGACFFVAEDMIRTSEDVMVSACKSVK